MTESVQPYFPSQVVFMIDKYTTFTVDEVNQRAFLKIAPNAIVMQAIYVMKKFPYAISGTPQSKYPVQLLLQYPGLDCFYATYWKFARNSMNYFPSHWLTNDSFEIKNYITFEATMIHSNDSPRDEDYWYSSKTCVLYTQETVPCEEIFFKKNTDIPVRSTKTVEGVHGLHVKVTNYEVLSIGNINETIFKSMPTNWLIACRDLDLDIVYDRQSVILKLNQSVEIKVHLVTPPHSIDGNDTVIIEWKPIYPTKALTWTPKTLSFNQENFHKDQILTFTRVEDSSRTIFSPFFSGGGFPRISPNDRSIQID